MGHLVKENFPNVLEFAKLQPWCEGVLSYGGNTFKQYVFYGDSSLFDIFPFQFNHGEIKKIFDEPNKIVLSERLSKKYLDSTISWRGYAYRVDQSWTYFVLPVIIIIFISLIANGFTLFKAAVQNPIVSLKEF